MYIIIITILSIPRVDPLAVQSFHQNSVPVSRWGYRKTCEWKRYPIGNPNPIQELGRMCISIECVLHENDRTNEKNGTSPSLLEHRCEQALWHNLENKHRRISRGGSHVNRLLRCTATTISIPSPKHLDSFYLHHHLFALGRYPKWPMGRSHLNRDQSEAKTRGLQIKREKNQHMYNI